MEWNVWKQTQWIIALYDNETEIKTNYYRVYRIIELNSWQELTIDIQTPINKPFNLLKLNGGMLKATSSL